MLEAGTGGSVLVFLQVQVVQAPSPPVQVVQARPADLLPDPDLSRPEKPAGAVGLSIVLRAPIPVAVHAKAKEILDLNYQIGTHVPLTMGGKAYVFASEWHPPHKEGEVGPKQWHRGVTVYVHQ